VGITLLLDGKTGVSSQQLVSNMVKAALLAHEQAGSIRLEIEQEKVRGMMSSDSLVVVPTRKEVEWPANTLEARLLLNRRASVSEIVFDWLGEESTDPWDRGAEQGKIMLVLRGIADVTVSKWGRRKYVLTKDTSKAMLQTCAHLARDLLADCRQSRPEVWKLLEKEIEKGVKRRTHYRRGEHDSFQDPDPWLAERVADQERFAVHVRPAMMPIWITIPLGIALALLVGWLAIGAEVGVFAAATAAVLTVVLGLFLLPFQPLRNIEKRILVWSWARLRPPGLVWEPTVPTQKDRFAGILVYVPILTGLVVLSRVYIPKHPVPSLILACCSGYGLFYLLRHWSKKKVADAITAKVTGGELLATELPIAEAYQETTTTPVAMSVDLHSLGPRVAETTARTEQVAEPADAATPSAEQPRARRPLPVALEVVTVDALPPASDKSSRRVEAIWSRGPSIRRAYHSGILLLAGLTTLLAIIYWLTGPSPFDFPSASDGLPERMPVFLLIALVVTLVRLSRARIGFFWVVLVRKFLSLMSGADDKMGTIRPAGLSLLGGIWVMIALLVTVAHYSTLRPPQGMLFSVASLACALGYLYWIHRSTIAIERRYPYQAPLNLLALRAFKSPYLSDFLHLTNAWQWVGTRQMLDGPDTTGQKMRDLINYFSGHIENSIVKDPQELREVLGHFRTQPDRHLRFPVNSMQCGDATWKKALQHLLDAMDVVVMDLSSLSEENRGVAYELGKLLDQIPMQRIILLINDSTDMSVLKDILAQSWNDMAADSPNRDTAEPRIRVYHIGGPSERGTDESLYDWKRRLSARLDEKHLVCLLCDAAQPARIPATIDPKRDREAIRWSRPMPPVFRLVRNIAFGIFLFFVLLISSCNMIRSS
jgi:hypothetical protein